MPSSCFLSSIYIISHPISTRPYTNTHFTNHFTYLPTSFTRQYLKKTPCISSVGGTAWVKEPKAGFDGVNTA